MSDTYELTVVYPADLGETKNKKALELLKVLVEKSKGEIIEKRDFGRKALAYPIKKKTEGYYAHWVVELPATGPGALTKAFSMDEKVLRYLVVKPKKMVVEMPKKKSVTKKKTKATSLSV